MDNQENSLNEQLNLQERIKAIEDIGKRYLSRDAVSRYGTLKAAHPELAISVMTMIANAAMAGEIKNIIDDVQFKGILKEVQNNRKETRIRRI